jgi:hypothetical protein
MFDEPPGSYVICRICFWEDDLLQLYYPHQAGGANQCNLIEGQVNFVQFGACERAMSKKVRKPAESDVRDEKWFPLWARRVDLPDIGVDRMCPQQLTNTDDLCYWLRNQCF